MRRRLAIEAHEVGRLLHHAIRLTRHHEGVVGEPDVDGLTAAPEGEQHRLGISGGHGPDGDRPLERGHGAPKALHEIVRLHRVTRHEGRDDLGIGGDGAGDAQPVLGHEVGVVVDVAVERSHHVRALGVGARLLFLVEWVGVGLGDDADAGPAGVAEQRDPGRGRTQGCPQQVVAVDGGANDAAVVTQFTDLGGGLVDEAQAPVHDPDGPGREERIPGASGDERRYSRVGEVQAVVPHEEVHPGRVATTNLEPVQHRQRLLDEQVALESGRAGITPCQFLDRAGRA